MPILYVRDKNTYEIVHIEESFISLVWAERYQETGDFVLDLPISEANFEVYKRGNYVQIDESEETMLIESINIDDDVDDPVLEVSGRTLSLYLERRVNASKLYDNFSETIEYSGSVSDVISSIVTDDMTDTFEINYEWRWVDESGIEHNGYGTPGGSEVVRRYRVPIKKNTPYRDISNFVYEDLTSINDITKKFSEIKTVYDIVVAMAKKYVFGFRIRLGDNGQLVFQTYKGIDRTTSQKVLDPVIFNPVMDNITYVNYFEDQTDYKNVAFVYSDGTWSPVEFNASFSTDIFSGFDWVTNNSALGDGVSHTTLTGLDRIEIPVDARSSASAKNYDPTEYYYPDEDTTPEDKKSIREKIISAGEEAFEDGDYDIVQTSEGAIDPLVRYEFEKDYFLGDMVEITNSVGSVMTAIIDEVVRSYDSNGFVTTPNFKSMADYDYGDEDENSDTE